MRAGSPTDDKANKGRKSSLRGGILGAEQAARRMIDAVAAGRKIDVMDRTAWAPQHKNKTR